MKRSKSNVSLSNPWEAGPSTSPTVNLPAKLLVARLLEEEAWSVRTPILEASIHQSKRSKIYVACFTAAEGGQRWKSTGSSNYDEALGLAQSWETEERQRRARLGRIPRNAGTRVRRVRGQADTGFGPFTQEETAAILNLSVRAVREIEHRALKKLRDHPALRDLWRDYTGGLEEASCPLGASEIIALFDLAIDPAELDLIERVLLTIQR